MKTTIIKGRTISNAKGEHTNKNAKYVIDLDNGDVWVSMTDCAEELGCSIYNVSACCNGKSRTCKGRHLALATDDIVDALRSSLKAKANELESTRTKLCQKALELDTAHTTSINREMAISCAYQRKKTAKAKVENLRVMLVEAEMEEAEANKAFDELMDSLYE